MKHTVDTAYISNRLSEEDVRHLARLARIAITDDEVRLFQQQLSEVIDYNMSLLSELDVAEIEPTSQTTGLTNVWAVDEPVPSIDQDLALSQAPKQRQGQFVVKKVLGGS